MSRIDHRSTRGEQPSANWIRLSTHVAFARASRFRGTSAVHRCNFIIHHFSSRSARFDPHFPRSVLESIPLARSRLPAAGKGLLYPRHACTSKHDGFQSFVGDFTDPAVGGGSRGESPEPISASISQSDLSRPEFCNRAGMHRRAIQRRIARRGRMSERAASGESGRAKPLQPLPDARSSGVFAELDSAPSPFLPCWTWSELRIWITAPRSRSFSSISSASGLRPPSHVSARARATERAGTLAENERRQCPGYGARRRCRRGKLQTETAEFSVYGALLLRRRFRSSRS